jgi:hypothetical protein
MEDKHVSRVESDVRIGYNDCCQPSGSGAEGDIASDEHERLLSQKGKNFCLLSQSALLIYLADLQDQSINKWYPKELEPRHAL